MKFVDVILPLAIPQTYTYSVADAFVPLLRIGIRVAVQLGPRKRYAGIVKAIHEQAPTAYKTRPILDVLDEEPVIYPNQLQFWDWMAKYYMATPGDVMNAALPAHLKLSSETVLLYNDVFGTDFSSLDDFEYLIAEALLIRKELRISEVQSILDKANVMSVIQRLIEKQVCLVYEELKESYKEKTALFVQLHPTYQQESLLEALFHQLEKAPKQLALLLAYLHVAKKEGKVLQAELLKKANATAAQLKSLVEKNIFEVSRQPIDRIQMGSLQIDLKFELSPAQHKAFTEIQQSFEQRAVTLLHGVTSSGKTEIYVKLIEAELQKGKQILYLLPEIALTTQIIRRLKKHFGPEIGIYHSRFSNNERLEIWNKVKKGQIRIVLGARSSLLLPFKDLGLLILDEEHDASYKQQDPAPRYHARDAAIYYASLFQAKVLLGSATPSLESYYNAQQGKYGLVTLSTRYGDIPLPEIEVVDLKKEQATKSMVHHFSSVLRDAMQQSLDAGKQIILFQNRRGYAPFLLCITCGHIPRCKQCDVSLTYHKNQDSLHCHYCGTRYPYVQVCSACGSPGLVPKNFGTEKIEEDLKELFPTARIARMDVDTVRSKDSHNRLIEALEQKDVDILVGTQMVVKGLDFENVNLVGIISADSVLSFPDFRVNERAFQLMEQVSGRAGRRDGKGKVLIQANATSHPILQDVSEHDYLRMYTRELADRKQFDYPPFSRLMRLTVKHKKEPVADEAAQVLGSWLRPRLQQALLGPSKPVVAFVRGLHLREFLIKLPKEAKSVSELKAFIRLHMQQLQLEKPYRSIQIIADVDGL
jgi:primosomal protein N' (replication factor Y)